MAIRVKGDRVLVKPDMVELKTQAGLIIAADKKIEQAGQQYGTLVAVGAEAWDDRKEPFAEIGDYVLYSQYAGKVVHDPADNNEGYVIMNDVDILATLDRPDETEGLAVQDAIVALDTRRESI